MYVTRHGANGARVPPNCSFEVDDLEKDWTWSKRFDLIVARAVTGCFRDSQGIVKKGYEYAVPAKSPPASPASASTEVSPLTQHYRSLEPGGYLEMHEFDLPYASDDGTMPEDNALYRAS